MSRKMLINATHPEEHRVAIVEDGFLTELDIEITGKEQTKGNIYKAAVVRVESGLQAAFVDYGGERLGFLQISEIHPSLYPASNGDRRNRPRINDILRSGQEILVQVLKEERGTKGAALTTFLSLAGRYMVLMPESPTKGVSRKIEEESERKGLKKAMAELDLPENMGYIVRTAGIGKTPDELRRDFENLVNVYRNIQERSRQVKAPSLIFRESNLIIRCIRDYFTDETEEVLVDDPEVFEEARDFFRMLMPEKARLVKLHQERRPIFSRYQIEEQIETINQNKVALPSGGSIVLDATEALVAIDVNSGKMASEQGIEATAYKTNIEAAVEAARQLRLRDLAGLIVIDFIDMRDRKHIRTVEKTLRDALKSDKARVTVGRISQFGLLEMSRQRLKPALAAASYLQCPHCQGHGRIKSIEAQGLAFLRRIHAAVAKGQIRRIEGRLPLEAASYLLNSKREELIEMERRYDLEIVLHGRSDLLPHQAEINLIRREKEEEGRERPETTPIELATQIDQIQPSAPEPAPQEQTAAAEAPPPADGAESDEGGKKKRRRRRRKKKPATEETQPGQVAAAETPAPPMPEEAGAVAPTEESAPAAQPATAEPVAAEPASEPQEAAPAKKKTRSRRGRKSAAGDQAKTAGESAQQEPAAAPSPAPSPAPTPAAAPPPAPEKPATEAVPETGAAPPHPEVAPEKAADKPAPAPRKRRTRAKKTETAPAPPGPATENADASDGEPSPTVAADAAPASPPPEKPKDNAAKKPAPRRRAPRKKAVATEPAPETSEKKPAEDTAAEANIPEKVATDDKTTAAQAVEKKDKAPAKPRRTRKAASPKQEKAAGATPSEPAPSAAAAGPGTGEDQAAAPKPRPRRTPARRKKTDDGDESPQSDSDQ